MAENAVRIEGGTVTAVPTGVANVTAVRSTSIKGVYDFSLPQAVGVVAANNFISLFNPVGSGRVLSLGSVFISSSTTAASTITEPLRGFRITSATGGTLQTTSAIAHFITSDPDTLAEVRTGNPTVTLGAPFLNSPPFSGGAAGSGTVHVIPVPGGLAPFTMVEGEGMVLRTNSGDIDQRWNISIVWSEV
ncbi:MAG TPA: hypothetical protein VIY48_19295 [Candidatus Paceibacterota bacterium]